MIVSWNWLKDYVKLDMTPEELANRLALSGLNHEGTEAIGDDLAIDLEVTSNRPDCLGHIGVAREIGVLWQHDLNIPTIQLEEGKEACSDLVSVEIERPDLCPRYIARVIKGVKVGPSPDWLAQRLTTLGIAVISNVVDITNYVMMECGQPLHAFNYDGLQGQKIIVRSAKKDEPFTAIDHHEYKLSEGMCVIADANRPVALAGVMGGEDTEVTSDTTNLLIEAADFAALPVRTTARALRLHSPSSYRFERGVDPEQIDWASRRACEMILDLAGGELAVGSVDAHPIAREPSPPVVLRLSQIERILGIELERDRVVRILTDLGLDQQSQTDSSLTFQAPSWRRDLGREIDLIEEIARIHGYEQIPEDVGVPMAPSHRQDTHRVLDRVRLVLTSQGFNEAMTPSVVDEQASNLFSPWSDAEPIRCSTPMLRGADCLRRSLIPSLLESRRTNEALANETIELFETAKVYLPSGKSLPTECVMLAITSGRDFRHLKGIVEATLAALHINETLVAEPVDLAILDDAESCTLSLGGKPLGVMGKVNTKGLKLAGLRKHATVAELKLEVLEEFSQLVPQNQTLSPYPSIAFDFNFVVDESVSWADLEGTVRSASGALLEAIEYQETYRDPKKDGKNKKRLLLSVRLRSVDHTLTGDEAESVHEAIIQSCQAKHAATLL